MAGSLSLVITEFVSIALICIYAIRYYKGNMVTKDVAISVYTRYELLSEKLRCF